jgi:hypothetical protein
MRIVRVVLHRSRRASRSLDWRSSMDVARFSASASNCRRDTFRGPVQFVEVTRTELLVGQSAV